MLKHATHLLTLGVLSPTLAGAQSLASPFASVSQRVDSTTITVEYYRPSVRGRRIFGGIVKYADPWTPGANWATTLEINRDVKLEGHALPAGKYSLWFTPAPRPQAWTVELNRTWRRFHVVRPDANEDQLRFTITPDSTALKEMLTFEFPVVTRDRATLAFLWAGTEVQLHFEISSSRPPITPAHSLASYTGVYELRPTWREATAAPFRYEIVERGGRLWVRTSPEFVEAGLDPEFDLLPAGDDDFNPRQYKGGQLVGDEPDELLVFSFEGDRVTGFEIHGKAEDKVLARATRLRR